MSETETVKVLLVEDDEDDYVLTRGLFTQMKERRSQLEWFRSYQLGLAAMLRNQHDVCLVDYRLGAKNGRGGRDIRLYGGSRTRAGSLYVPFPMPVYLVPNL